MSLNLIFQRGWQFLSFLNIIIVIWSVCFILCNWMASRFLSCNCFLSNIMLAYRFYLLLPLNLFRTDWLKKSSGIWLWRETFGLIIWLFYSPKSTFQLRMSCKLEFSWSIFEDWFLLVPGFYKFKPMLGNFKSILFVWIEWFPTFATI